MKFFWETSETTTIEIDVPEGEGTTITDIFGDEIPVPYCTTLVCTCGRNCHENADFHTTVTGALADDQSGSIGQSIAEIRNWRR